MVVTMYRMYCSFSELVCSVSEGTGMAEGGLGLIVINRIGYSHQYTRQQYLVSRVDTYATCR
jgi:hypothetical protein